MYKRQANAVEFEYRRFLTLMKKYPHEQTSPLVDVDTFWHYHILDTMKYAADCEAVFGYFLHHFPYVGMRGEEDEAALARIGQRMKELYEAEFGEDYVRPAKRAFEGATQANAFCGSPEMQANAFCGSPEKQANAFCGSPEKQANAFCGSPEEKVAFCGSPEKAMTAKVPNQPGLFSGRPTLS